MANRKSKDPRVPRSVSLKKSTWDRIEERAKTQDTAISQVVEDAVLEALNK